MKEQTIGSKIARLYSIAFRALRLKFACWVMPEEAFDHIGPGISSYLETLENEIDNLENNDL